jgi:hypothetical protein
VVDVARLREEERHCIIRRQAKKVLEAALQATPMYRFLSLRDIIFLTFSEFGKSVSWRRACQIMDLFEREKALFRNGNLRTKGCEIHPKRARRFLTTVM